MSSPGRPESWTVARVPGPVRRQVEARLRKLVEALGWSLIDPADVTLVIADVASIAHQMAVGARLEVIAEIRARAIKLQGSEDLDDLVAAGELDDLATDLESSDCGDG